MMFLSACSNTSTGSLFVRSLIKSNASYSKRCATSLLPSIIMRLMSLVTNLLLKIGSGNTSRRATGPFLGIVLLLSASSCDIHRIMVTFSLVAFSYHILSALAHDHSHQPCRAPHVRHGIEHPEGP